jgi:hypothetical protein
MSNGFEDIVLSTNPAVQHLARQAKALITSIMPNVVEIAWPAQNIIGYGVGPKKMSEQFCYIALFKERINLGFYYGADLPDPAHLLEGTGNALQHVKISSVEQLENPALVKLVEEASRYLPKLKK